MPCSIAIALKEAAGSARDRKCRADAVRLARLAPGTARKPMRPAPAPGASLRPGSSGWATGRGNTSLLLQIRIQAASARHAANRRTSPSSAGFRSTTSAPGAGHLPGNGKDATMSQPQAGTLLFRDLPGLKRETVVRAVFGCRGDAVARGPDAPGVERNGVGAARQERPGRIDDDAVHGRGADQLAHQFAHMFGSDTGCGGIKSIRKTTSTPARERICHAAKPRKSALGWQQAALEPCRPDGFARLCRLEMGRAEPCSDPDAGDLQWFGQARHRFQLRVLPAILSRLTQAMRLCSGSG